METFTHIVACLPMLGLIIFRIAKPRLYISEIEVEKIHSDPKRMLVFLFFEGIAYGYVAYVCKPRLDFLDAIFEYIMCFTFSFLSIWCMGHAVYIWRRVDRAGKLFSE